MQVITQDDEGQDGDDTEMDNQNQTNVGMNEQARKRKFKGRKMKKLGDGAGSVAASPRSARSGGSQ